MALELIDIGFNTNFFNFLFGKKGVIRMITKDIKVGDRVTHDNVIGKVIQIEQLLNYSTKTMDKFYLVEFDLMDEEIEILFTEDEIKLV